MSKLLRSELKDIVKECLLEILSEGINSSMSNTNMQKKQSIKENISKSQKRRGLDNIGHEKKQQNRSLNANFKTALTTDATLNEILADTAKSTLQEQISAERRGAKSMIANDPVSKIVDKSNPEDLFGEEAASKWAQLAFFNQP